MRLASSGNALPTTCANVIVETNHLYEQLTAQEEAFLQTCITAYNVNMAPAPHEVLLGDHESLTNYVSDALSSHREHTLFKEEWDPVYNKSQSPYTSTLISL